MCTRASNNLQVSAATNRRSALTPIVLYTKVDASCDKLATDDRRQFLTLSVHLSWQQSRRSTCSLRHVTKSRVWDNAPEASTLILGDTRITFQYSLGKAEGSLFAENKLVLFRRFNRTPTF